MSVPWLIPLYILDKSQSTVGPEHFKSKMINWIKVLKGKPIIAKLSVNVIAKIRTVKVYLQKQMSLSRP